MKMAESLAIAIAGGILAGLTGCGGSAPGAEAPMNMAAPSASAGEKHDCSAGHDCSGKKDEKKDEKGGAKDFTPAPHVD